MKSGRGPVEEGFQPHGFPFPLSKWRSISTADVLLNRGFYNKFFPSAEQVIKGAKAVVTRLQFELDEYFAVCIMLAQVRADFGWRGSITPRIQLWT